MKKEVKNVEKSVKVANVAKVIVKKVVNKAGAYSQVGKMYQKAMSFIRSKQVVSRDDVIEFYKKEGKSLTAATASATVLLSPRKEDSVRGKFGNCLGNFSADGVNYYMIPTKSVKGQEKKFRFHLSSESEKIDRQAISDKRGNGRKAKKEVSQVKEVISVVVPVVETVPVIEASGSDTSVR